MVTKKEYAWRDSQGFITNKKFENPNFEMIHF